MCGLILIFLKYLDDIGKHELSKDKCLELENCYFLQFPHMIGLDILCKQFILAIHTIREIEESFSESDKEDAGIEYKPG